MKICKWRGGGINFRHCELYGGYCSGLRASKCKGIWWDLVLLLILGIAISCIIALAVRQADALPDKYRGAQPVSCLASEISGGYVVQWGGKCYRVPVNG